MARYEFRLYMKNGCGQALLGEVAAIDAPDETAALAEARRRVRELPKHFLGALYDPAGAQIWTEDAPSR